MKKVLMLFACLSVFALSASAQKACSKSKASCAKTCTKSKSMTQAAASVDDAVVAKAASMTEGIERKVCAKSGTVSYHQSYKCSETGKMTSKEVMYDAASAKFVNVSPSDMKATAKAGKKACSPAAGKACCASKGKKANLKADNKMKKVKVKESSSME